MPTSDRCWNPRPRLGQPLEHIEVASEFVEAHASAETMAEFQGLLLQLEQADEAVELERYSLVSQ
jgi:hypothetical protein